MRNIFKSSKLRHDSTGAKIALVGQMKRQRDSNKNYYQSYVELIIKQQKHETPL
jgi:hypothetical protein